MSTHISLVLQVANIFIILYLDKTEHTLKTSKIRHTVLNFILKIKINWTMNTLDSTLTSSVNDEKNHQ